MAVLPDPSGIAQGIQQAGGAFGQALQDIAKRRRIQDIMSPMTSMSKPNQKGISDTYNEVVNNGNEEPIPVADKIFNDKMAQINELKTKAALLEGEGYHPQAQMMQQEALQKENFLQQERMQNLKMGQKIEAEKDKRAFEENKPYYENLNKKRTELPSQQATLLSIRDNLINSGGKIEKLRNFISTYAPADAQDFIKSANAQQLASFVKDYFVADLKGLPGGSKLNQLIEKNLLSALQSPGKTEESNQKITEFQQFKQDVIEKELEISDRLKNKYLKAGQEPPRGFQQMVHDQLKPYVMEKQRELIQTYKDIDNGKFKSAQMLNMPFLREEIKETPARPGYTWIASPNGKKAEVPNELIQEALNSGGKIIK